MSSYGGYEPRRTHAGGVSATLCEAAAADGRPGRFALKRFHPPPSTRAGRLFLVEGWLLAAERQGEAARTEEAVVPVEACGRGDGGAWAVYPWIGVSVEGLLEALAPTGDRVRALAAGLLEGLARWERAYGGPHGNLKPGNVFLAGDGPLAARRVRLTHPAFAPGGGVEERRRRDLAAVGAMLVRLVRRRAAGGWPIEEAPEWRDLGRAGGPLRDFCNALLDPHAAPGAGLTLAEAVGRLERIPADLKPARTVARAAAGVAVLGAAGTLAFARFGSFEALPPRLVPLAEALGNPRVFRTEVASEWAHLCRAWNGWVADALRSAERWEKEVALWLADDALRPVVRSLREMGAALDPRAVVPEAAGFSLGLLAEAPPEAVREELLRSSVDARIQRSWRHLETFAAALAEWPRWAEIERTAGRLETGAFPRAAASLRALRAPAGVTGAQGAAPVVQAFNQLSQDADGALLVLERWARLEALEAACAASGDRVQAAMPRLALARLTDRASLGDFAEALAGPIGEIERRRSLFLDPAVARDRFLREARTPAPGEAVGESDLTTWEEEIARHRRVAPDEDPRSRDDWPESLRELRVAAGELEETAPPAEPGAAPLARAEALAAAADLETRLAALASREILRKDIPATEGDVAALRAALGDVRRRVEATQVLLRPERWLERIRAVAWRLGPVARRWERWRDEALAGETVATLEADAARFRDLRQREQRIRAWLSAFEREFGPDGLPPPPLTALADETRAALLAWERARRESLTESLLATRWSAAGPSGEWDSATERAATDAALGPYRRWLDELGPLGSGLEEIGRLLRDGADWNEGLRAAVGAVGGDLAGLGGAPGEWLEQANAVGRLSGEGSREALIRAAGEEAFPVRLAAWRALGRRAGWPGSAEDLELEAAATEALRGAIAGLANPEAKARLGAELAEGARRRWNAAARGAGADEAALEAVFGRLGRVGLTAEDLEPAAGFNLRLWQLRQATGSEGDIDYWRERRDRFVAAARMHPEVAGRADVGRLLEALDALALRDAGHGGTSLSPARAGWRETLADGGQRVVATWSRGGRTVRLEYQLVEPADGGTPFYLARRHLAVGEFLALLDTRPEGAEILEAMPRWVLRDGDSGEPWSVPLTWRPRADRAGIELNARWIYRPDAQLSPLLAAGADGGGGAGVGSLVRERPTERSPLQRVAPDLARRICGEMLGARLPTPAEWRSLADAARAAEPGNRRDARFAALWRHLETSRAGEQAIAWRPNRDIFLPLQTLREGTRTRRMPLADDGRAAVEVDDGHLFPADVDAGPETFGMVHLLGNVWTYLHDPGEGRFYVAGGSALSPPGLDPREPQRVEGIPLIGNSRGQALTDGFSDVGVRPAFDAPPGVRDRLEMFRLVRAQQFLTL